MAGHDISIKSESAYADSVYVITCCGTVCHY